MNAFAHRRCFVHAGREAICLCTECRHSFCRECATELDGRLVCNACVIKLRQPARKSRSGLRYLSQAGSMAAALVLAWALFYMAGRLFLLAQPGRHTFADSATGNP